MLDEIGDRKGGGVSLLISEKFMYTGLQELTTAEDHMECVFVKILYNGNAFIVGTVYRPPNCNMIDLIILWLISWKDLPSFLFYNG